MRTNSLYGITRVDSEARRTHAWLVTIQRRGTIHRKNFSDGLYGGKKKSLKAAKDFRDEIIKKYPPFSLSEYASIRRSNNKSGVAGVCRYCASRTRDLPEDQRQWFWVAAWPARDGKRKRVRFSVHKFGEEAAFNMALKARQDGMKALEGTFDPGASQRADRRRRNSRLRP